MNELQPMPGISQRELELLEEMKSYKRVFTITSGSPDLASCMFGFTSAFEEQIKIGEPLNKGVIFDEGLPGRGKSRLARKIINPYLQAWTTRMKADYGVDIGLRSSTWDNIEEGLGLQEDVSDHIKNIAQEKIAANNPHTYHWESLLFRLKNFRTLGHEPVPGKPYDTYFQEAVNTYMLLTLAEVLESPDTFIIWLDKNSGTSFRNGVWEHTSRQYGSFDQSLLENRAQPFNLIPPGSVTRASIGLTASPWVREGLLMIREANQGFGGSMEQIMYAEKQAQAIIEIMVNKITVPDYIKDTIVDPGSAIRNYTRADREIREHVAQVADIRGFLIGEVFYKWCRSVIEAHVLDRSAGNPEFKAIVYNNPPILDEDVTRLRQILMELPEG